MRNFNHLWLFTGLWFLACDGQVAVEERAQGGSPSTTAGGAATVASASTGGGGIALAGGSATLTLDVSPSAPNYDRSCIEAALAASATSATGNGGAPTINDADAGMAAAGSPSANVSAADLGLGTGDLTVLVLFDKSGSMSSGWDERSKWQVANDSLMNALRPVLDLITIGTIFFPIPGDCNVAPLDSGLQIDFMAGRDFRSLWEQTADSRGPGGMTPLALAMQIADMAIEKACRLGLLERRFRVVIVTDGEPNCGVDVTTLPRLPAEWNRLGVETRVMGLPGSQGALDLMDQIAAAGGSGKCISLGTPQQMNDQMQAALM